jgi:hypothetical protein
MSSLTTMNLPELSIVGNSITISFMAALTGVSLPKLNTVGGSILFTSGTAALNSLTIGSTIKAIGGTVTITSAALTQSVVDGILARLAALNGTGGTVAFSSKTVTITGTSATPSAAGLASKAILVGRGCTVTHN